MKKYLGVLFAVLLTVACLVVPASAAEDYPDFDTHGHSNYIVLFKNNSQYELILFDDLTPLYGYQYGKHCLTFENSSSVSQTFFYSSCKSGSWESFSNHSIASNSRYACTDAEPLEIVESSCNIYDYETGELFFPLPPAPQPGLGEVVEGLTLTQGEAVRNQVVGLMKILVPCGVGCLALLMVFPTLKKGLFRFLT